MAQLLTPSNLRIRERLDETNVYSKFLVEPSINIKYYRTLNVNTSFCLDLIKFLVDANPMEKIGILLTGANWIRKSKLEAILALENVNQILNIHFGDCLNYRGLDSNLWALYHRDSPSLGISIHLVENILDAGDRVIFTSLPSPTSYTNFLESQIECAFLAISELMKISSDSNDFDFPERVSNDGSGRYYGLMPSVLKKHIHQRFD